MLLSDAAKLVGCTPKTLMNRLPRWDEVEEGDEGDEDVVAARVKRGGLWWVVRVVSDDTTGKKAL